MRGARSPAPSTGCGALGGHVLSAAPVRRCEGAALGTPQREVLGALDRRVPDAARRRLMVPAGAAARLGLAHRRVEELLLVVKAQWRWVRHMVWGRAHVVDALRRSTQATTCGPRERPETAAEPPAALGGPAAPRAPPRRAEMPQVSGEGSEMSQRISKASALRASRGLPGCRGDCHGSRRCPVPVRRARRARSRAWACRGGAPPQSRKWFAGVARFAHHFATQSPWPVWQIFLFFFSA